jgi:hypothetical protein
LIPLLISACHEAPVITDINAFCSQIEGGHIDAGGRTLVSITAITNIGGYDRPFDEVPVAIDVAGGLESVPSLDISVCGGDCEFASANNFSRHAVVDTTSNGVLIFTVNAGKQAGGFLLLDFGTATCVVPVGTGQTATTGGGGVGFDAGLPDAPATTTPDAI